MTEKETPLLLTKEGNFTDRDCGNAGVEIFDYKLSVGAHIN